LPETSIEEAKNVAERIRNSIQNKIIYYKDLELNVTASFGVSTYNNTRESEGSPPKSIDEIIDMADKALYGAKESGRNQVVVSR
jgi:diguanylate cyclase (GGDEF)-like protein